VNESPVLIAAVRAPVSRRSLVEPTTLVPGYADNFFAICATCRPWKRAAAISFSLAMRSPLLPAIVGCSIRRPASDLVDARLAWNVIGQSHYDHAVMEQRRVGSSGWWTLGRHAVLRSS